jgi:hypothetical protein
MGDNTSDLSGDRRWTPALRRALMRVRPEFFGWSIPEQDRYRVNIPDSETAEIDRLLQKELFGFANAKSELDDAQLERFNTAILPLHGIGEDCFYLNEWLADGVSILEFETVLDYDRHDHLFQEECRKKESPDYVARPYRGSLYFLWARLFVDGRLTYATLSMAAAHLHSELEEHGMETIQALIPHRHVPGKDHGRRVDGGYAWDMCIDADGKEGLLEELRQLSFVYERRRHEELTELWDHNAATGLFVRDRDIPEESNRDFVFTDKTALEAVRFRSFLHDCREIERPFDELDAQARRERSAVDDYLRVEHARLLKDFDPAVVKLRKKRKVIVHKNAADKLF